MLHGGMLSNGPAEFGSAHGRKWLVTDYEAGDVVLHNAYSIHASTMNYDVEGVIRLGTDLRFVDSSRPWDQVCVVYLRLCCLSIVVGSRRLMALCRGGIEILSSMMVFD